MITELDIEVARLAVDTAAQDLADAELLPPGPGVGAVWAGANGRLRYAVAAHARLVEQSAAEQAAAEAFAVAEKAAGKRITMMSKEVAAGREHLQGAVSAAQVALVALLDAIGERNSTIAGHAAELAELGLAMPDGAEHQNGAMRHGAVRLRGEWWAPVDPAALLQLVVQRVTAARFGAHGGVELQVQRVSKLLGLLHRADLDLEAVPLPPTTVETPRATFASGGTVTGATVGISEYRAEQERKDREVTYTTPVPGRDGPRFV